MSANAPIESKTTSLLAQVVAGAFMSQVEGPRELRRGIGMLRKFLGDKTETFITSMAGVQKTLAYACVDEAIFDGLSEGTRDLFAQLPADERVIAEMLYARLTGKMERTDSRWAPPVWRLKQMLAEYQTFSPTQISKEDLAKVFREIAADLVVLIRLEGLKMIG